MTTQHNTGVLYHNHFAKSEFWKERYCEKKDTFEWYHPYRMLKDVVTQYITDNKSAKLLNVGCGISKMPEDLFNEGFRNIVNIDISEECIREMNKHFNESMKKHIYFLKMDAKDMDFTNGVFTHVLDKGLFDSIMSGYRSTENIHKYLSEVHRVLSSNGTYFCMSYKPFEDRCVFLEKFNWNITVHKIYRPVFKTELKWIKQEFFSKAVIKDIEKQLDLEIDRTELEHAYPDERDFEIVQNILADDKKAKEEELEERLNDKPKNVLTFYLYVCKKGKIDRGKSAVKEAPVFEINVDAVESPSIPRKTQIDEKQFFPENEEDDHAAEEEEHNDDDDIDELNS